MELFRLSRINKLFHCQISPLHDMVSTVIITDTNQASTTLSVDTKRSHMLNPLNVPLLWAIADIDRDKLYAQYQLIHDDTVKSRTDSCHLLSVESCEFTDLPHSVPYQQAIFKHLTSLKRLKLSNRVEVDTDRYSVFFPLMKKLQSIDLSGCDSITDGTFSALNLLTNLHTGTILFCLLYCSVLIYLCCINLFNCVCMYTTVKASKCYRITDRAIEYLADGCNDLHTLVLDGCINITHASIYYLHRNEHIRKQLKHINISQCFKIQPIGLRQLGRFVSLEVVDISQTRNVVDSVLLFFITLSKLTSVNLSGCTQTTDEGLRLLVSKCTELQIILLGYCNRITDMGVSFLCGLPNLRVLDLFIVNRLTDQSWSAFSRMPKLERLNLGGCHLLTDALDTATSAATKPGILPSHVLQQVMVNNNRCIDDILVAHAKSMANPVPVSNTSNNNTGTPTHYLIPHIIIQPGHVFPVAPAVAFPNPVHTNNNTDDNKDINDHATNTSGLVWPVPYLGDIRYMFNRCTTLRYMNIYGCYAFSPTMKTTFTVPIYKQPHSFVQHELAHTIEIDHVCRVFDLDM